MTVTTTKIAVIGSNQTAVTALAEQLASRYGARVLINQKDEMLELLRLDMKKYFSAYQLHLLLNRIHHLKESGNVIICDTLHADFCAMNAALATGIISAPEYKLYKQKHDEFMESFSCYDYVYYIEDEMNVQQVEAPFSELSIHYWQLCINSFKEQIHKLADQLKERFIILPAAENDSIPEEEFTSAEAIEVRAEVSDEAEKSIQERLQELQPHVQFVASVNEIKEFISQYQDNIDISAFLPCICIEDDYCTCMKLTYDEQGEEIIRCQKKSSPDEIIAFFND